MKRFIYLFLGGLSFWGVLSLVGCLSEGTDSIILRDVSSATSNDPYDQPGDNVPGYDPSNPNDNNSSDPGNSTDPGDSQGGIPSEKQEGDIANGGDKEEQENGFFYNYLTLLGVKDTLTGNWLDLVGTDGNLGERNVAIYVDQESRYVTAYNNLTGDKSQDICWELILLIDNSSSMMNFIEKLASKVVNWTLMLTESGSLDIKYSYAAYNALGTVEGGMNFGSPVELSENFIMKQNNRYLNSFLGNDSLTIKAAAQKYQSLGEECCVTALKFADENYDFRPGVGRIYLNMTDEPNHPGGDEKWSVHSIEKDWSFQQGSIHTVYFTDQTGVSYEDSPLHEQPWLLSYATGGTIQICKVADFSLANMPLSSSLLHSSILKYKIPNSLMDNQEHDVQIVIYDNERIISTRSFKKVFQKN